MIQLSRYFTNPFSQPSITAEELRRFAEDHLARLQAAASKPALALTLEPLLRAGQEAFAAFDAALSRRADVLAAREGGTVGKDDVVRLFKTRVRQREGRVKDQFAVGSAAYEEFFPRGLTEFNRVTVGRVPQLLDRMVEKAKKYEAQVGPEMAKEFGQLREQFAQARGGQMESAGGLAEARSSLASARGSLELRLATNLLTLALEHLGQPERAKDYFDQSILDDATRSTEEAPTAAAEVA